MKIVITPKKLKGRIQIPPSKSQSHRLIIGAALADGVSRLSNLAESQDMDCMRNLGAEISSDGSQIKGVSVQKNREQLPVLDCGESGSTIRFLMPVALAVAGGGVFHGRGRLLERPYAPYETIFTQQRIHFQRQSDRMILCGGLKPGRFELPGDISSQFITGLLYALPLLKGDSQIVLTTVLESRGYVDMTLEALSQFGVAVSATEQGWFVPGNQTYRRADVTVEGDYSQASNFILATSIGNELQVDGLQQNSVQGDRMICQYAQRLDNAGEVVLDVSQCPDLVPALAMRAALREGQLTRIIRAARLRLKESDRLDAVTTELNRIGGQVEQSVDALTIRGVRMFHGNSCDSHQDHRIAMMLAMAATCSDGRILVNGAESVAKSYPNFWEDYKSLGGLLDKIL